MVKVISGLERQTTLSWTLHEGLTLTEKLHPNPSIPRDEEGKANVEKSGVSTESCMRPSVSCSVGKLVGVLAVAVEAGMPEPRKLSQDEVLSWWNETKRNETKLATKLGGWRQAAGNNRKRHHRLIMYVWMHHQLISCIIGIIAIGIYCQRRLWNIVARVSDACMAA